MNVEKFQFF